MSKSVKKVEIDVCADCGRSDPTWASINHGVLICDQCAIVHRSLGRFISQITPLKASNWKASQLQMVYDLYHSGSNSIWEHTLLDPHMFSSTGSSSNIIKGFSSHSNARKKPLPNDPLTPNKSDFIRAKYQSLSFVNKSHSIKEDAETESDISEQLHSSVRTPNLKTSLRLLAAGANPNYMHTEKFNSPLHMASKSGQMSQIELLLIYGANISNLDAHGKSPIDYAKEAGHTEIVYRLIEQQFDLPDRLSSFICQGRQPNHRNGEHFLIIDIKPEFLNFFPFPPETEKLINNNNATSVYRSELYQNIHSLSHKSFHELTRDVYDEIDRREINVFVSKFYSNDNGKLSANHQQLITPFLPVYQFFTSTRNQERQKLALLNIKEFTLLIIDILNEIRHRIFGLSSWQDIKNSIYSTSTRFNDDFDDDSEPLYDSVPSEEDYDECNELLSPDEVKKKPLVSNKPSFLSNKYSTITKVDSDEFCTMKDQITNLIKQEFTSENKTMRDEISRLHNIVERLVEENAELKQILLSQKEESISTSLFQPLLHNDLKSNSVLGIDPMSDSFNRNSFLRNSNRIRPQSSMSYSNNLSNNILPNESISMQTSSVSTNNTYLNNYYQTNSQLVPPPFGSNSILFSTASPSSAHSSQQQLQSGQISPSQQHRQFPSPMSSLTNFHSNSFNKNATPLPSKEDVIKKIEFITDGIKELLGNAREGRHEKFKFCSEKICQSVSDMINLFPESIATSKNWLHLHQALSSLNANTLRLNKECTSMYEYNNYHKPTSNQDYRYIYGNVIDKAAEVASSVKSIVNFYNC